MAERVEWHLAGEGATAVYEGFLQLDVDPAADPGEWNVQVSGIIGWQSSSYLYDADLEKAQRRAEELARAMAEKGPPPQVLEHTRSCSSCYERWPAGAAEAIRRWG